jgi:hypothetical protein
MSPTANMLLVWRLGIGVKKNNINMALGARLTDEDIWHSPLACQL